jgi:hypothetical protein
MLNAGSISTSDTLSENDPYPTSIAPVLPPGQCPSPDRPGRPAHSKSAYSAASPKAPAAWATTLAVIHHLSSAPDTMRNSPDLSNRRCVADVPSGAAPRLIARHRLHRASQGALHRLATGGQK